MADGRYLGQMDSDESEEESQEELVSKALIGYCSELGRNEIANILQVELNACLICLSSVKRIQAVWNCRVCYTSFHLVCIQQWAKDGIQSRNSVLSEALFPGVVSKWTCPKCRIEYERTDVPSRYQCFCGKKYDPPPDPWLLAHSCGEVCGHDLKFNCGHKCLSLCHPGPCPPCPKTVLINCFCGKSSARSQRCGLPGWSCGRVCQRTLVCAFHTCEQLCHEGACPPCGEWVVQSCVCGKEVRNQQCGQFEWSCGTVCGKLLPCGLHLCEQVCHSGECGDCPRRGRRVCPCGKKEYIQQDCESEVMCCGDTCGKALACGRHKCVRMCHQGDCGPCLQMTEKSCRCGQKTKSISCAQNFICESKCQRMRQCGHHLCRRKCCDGDCPPCDRVCGRPLPCKTHKCSAPCHSGRCYPCVLTVALSCACGKTVANVPCGRQRTTKPPLCSQVCQRQPICHHKYQTPHRCHFGECPPCELTCSLPLSCGHLCQAICHARPVQQHPTKPLAPWKKVEQLHVVKPCPPCKQLVLHQCYGGHLLKEFPCSSITDYSCGQKCNRMLNCGNHTCQLNCHKIKGAYDELSAGEDCLSCAEECKNPRHPECTHQCPLPCHSGGCPPCERLIKLACHCGNLQLYIKCNEWCEADMTKRDCLRSCKNQCSKQLDCGHGCLRSCHSGPCSLPGDHCKRKTLVRCPCRRLKKEWRCSEKKELQCDEGCMLAIQQQNEAAEKAATEVIMLKEREEREAAALLERQLRPRKRKRKVMQVESSAIDVPMYKTTLVKACVGCLLFCLTLFIIYIVLLSK